MVTSHSGRVGSSPCAGRLRTAASLRNCLAEAALPKRKVPARPDEKRQLLIAANLTKVAEGRARISTHAQLAKLLDAARDWNAWSLAFAIIIDQKLTAPAIARPTLHAYGRSPEHEAPWQPDLAALAQQKEHQTQAKQQWEQSLGAELQAAEMPTVTAEQAPAAEPEEPPADKLPYPSPVGRTQHLANALFRLHWRGEYEILPGRMRYREQLLEEAHKLAKINPNLGATSVRDALRITREAVGRYAAQN